MAQTARLYRMVTPEHICPFGLKTRDLLKRKGYEVKDHLLTSRQETEWFKDQYQVDTTPQTFIDDQRIGGYEEVRHYFGKQTSGQHGTTYTPVIAVLATCLLMAAGLAWFSQQTLLTVRWLEVFVALSMCVLAILKLRDLTAFTNQFITYDLLSMRVVRYAYVYPFAEAYTGIGMLAALSAWLVAPVGFFIGTVGAISVFKAVYVDKRELKCACVGGDSNVPLGFVSLTENLFMVGAAIWMWIK